MRTARQIEASRRNGARSQGPVTVIGKCKSSRNSRRHGLYSQTVEPEDIPACVTEAIANFRASLEAEYCPPNAEPNPLVESVIRGYGLLRRIVALEKTVMDREIACQRLAHPEASQTDLQSMAFTRLSNETGVIRLIDRLEGRSFRYYERAIDRLTSRRPRGLDLVLEKSKNAETNPTGSPRLRGGKK